MTRIKMDKKGVYSENAPDDPVTISIPSLANTNASVLVANNTGQVSVETLASRTRYEYYEQVGEQVVSNSLSYTHLQVNGADRTITTNMSTWNTGSSIFYPEVLNALYTVTFNGYTTGTAGGPDLVMSFIRSGSNPLTAEIINNQTTSFIIRATAPFTYIHAVYNVIATEELMTSGAILLATSTGNPITITTSSLLIKEG